MIYDCNQERSCMDTEDSYIEYTIRSYSSLVFRIAYTHLCNYHNAEDIYQDVFLTFVKTKPNFENEVHKKAWFTRVTINKCKNYWNSAWFRHSAVLDTEETVEMNLDPQYEDLYQAIREIPFKYRSVIYLFYFEECSIQEMVDILETKEGTICSRLTRARKMLKNKLKGVEAYETECT